MSTLYDTLSPVITAVNNFITSLDVKFNYSRASSLNTGSATWIKKAGTPTGSDGADGNYCTDTTNSILYGPRTSGTWPVLPAGAVWYSGASAPASTLGRNGDYYFATTVPTIYGPKTGGSWGTGYALGGGGASNTDFLVVQVFT